jgi:hypothetical protein
VFARIDRHAAPSLDRYFIAREFTRAAKVFEGNWRTSTVRFLMLSPEVADLQAEWRAAWINSGQ